ncbi:MAG TPA: hypothetical protein VHS59_04590 [Bacillota bacterium]|nr:hypothetical protein [Bacillota bacterium]
MKKLVAAACLIVILSFAGPVLAADALYRMLHADEVESFKQDQDALIVGQLVSMEDGKFSVQVLKVLSGKVDSDTILVSSDFRYGWSQTLPQVKDYCVLSLKRSQGVYKKAWGIFKADGGDYKTLKLLPENAKGLGLQADLACIEWYVNSGGKEKDFSFNSGTAYVKRPNGQVVQVYPKEAIESTAPTGSVQEEPADGNREARWSGTTGIYLALIAVSLITASALYLWKRKATGR